MTAETANEHVEYTVDQRTFLVYEYYKQHTDYTQIFADNGGTFPGAPIPHWESVYRLIKKFECTSSVGGCPQSVRMDANKETVALTFVEDFAQSAVNVLQQLGIPRCSLCRPMHNVGLNCSTDL